VQAVSEASSENGSEEAAGFDGYSSSRTAVATGNPLLSLREWMSPENVALFVICMADMLSTLYFVHSGAAVEDNPVFRQLLQRGDGTFVFMKFASFMPLIATSTYYRRRRPKLIIGAMRLTVGVYIALYILRLAAEFFGV
jgi:hypothetical protein